MKMLPQHRQRIRGGATLAVVAAISLAMLSMLAYTLSGSFNSFDSQVDAQMKQDFSQKEDAVLTALLQIVPNKAIGAMQRNSANDSDEYTWAAIFDEAIAIANAEQSIDPDLLASLDLENAIIANTGDLPIDEASAVVAAPVRTYAGGDNLVNGGNWWEFYMLGDGAVGPHVPAPLEVSYQDYLLDKEYPIISHRKTHNYWYTKGVELPAENYPLYNLITYPDVKFGYKKPGELFVAKRNWWVFSLTFGDSTQAQTGVPAVTKTYVLSIYEIPSQLPLSGSTLMKVGRFADGTDWENVELQGGLYADILQTEGSVEVTGGSLAARNSIDLSDSTSVDGETMQSNFDELGEREERALQSDSDFHELSVGGNVGKVAFVPINPGYDFLKRSGDGSASRRISPTGWRDYSRGANQAEMRLDFLAMHAEDTQIPTKIKFYYTRSNGGNASITYERGDNWPTDLQPGGTEFPFQTTQLANGRNALVFNLDRFPDFLDSLGNAADITVNDSIYISPLNSGENVQAPSYPSLSSDVCVTLRGGKDMTDYTRGFSVVSDVRLYIGETLNAVATAPPANSGLALDDEFYPPISLFAPEKRFGESPSINRPLSLRGQISSLKNSISDTFNPMELMMADDERVDTDLLNADLVTLRSPAELPPVHLMNWMITIEEIH